jgi:hypothetical protein
MKNQASTETGTKVARRVVCVLSAGLVLLAAAPAHAPAQEAGARRLEDVLPPEHATRVRELAREAQEAGVPPALIARKAFEGAAKGYPPDRIVTALESYAGRLHDASALLGPDRRPASMAAAAEALRRGVPPDAIRSLASRDRAGRDMTVPLIVLGELTEAGVPAGDALDMVNGAVDRGARGDRMLGLSAAVRRRIRRGEDWRSAVDAVRRRAEQGAMRRGRDPEDGGQLRRSPSRRETDSPPVPPGSEPPHRSRDGG